jgi:hypothetical protein
MSIYTYNGLEFSEEDVIAKAEEKGLDLDSYINEFGIKRKEDKAPGKPKTAVKKDVVAAVKSTVSKSEPFSSEQQGFDISDPTGANKTFAKSTTKATKLYKQPPVLSDVSASRYNSFDFSALDKNQKSFNFKEEGISSEFKAKKAKEQELKQEDDLRSLQKLNKTTVRNTKSYQEALNIINQAGNLDEDFNAELEADIQFQKQKNGKLETITMPSGGIAGFGGGTGQESSYKFAAFPEERKQIINQFKKQNKAYSENDLVELSAELYKNKKEKQRIYNQKFEAFETLDGYNDDVKSFLKDYTKNEDQITDIDLAKITTQKNYTQGAIEKKAKDQALLESKLKPIDPNSSSQEEVDNQNLLIQEVNKGRQELKTSLEHYKDLNESENKLQGTSTTLKQDIELQGKEWGWWSRTGLKTLNAFGTFGGAIAGGVAYLADLGIQSYVPLATQKNYFGDIVSERAKSNREFFDSNIAKPRETMSSIEAFGENSADAILNQLPLIATTILAPEALAPEIVGFATGLVTGTGSKYSSMLEEQKYGSFDKEGNKTMPNYDAAQLIAIPLLFGAFEGGSEYVGGRAIGRMQKTFGKATKEEANFLLDGARKSINQKSSEFAKSLLQNYGEEIPTEVINTVLGNVTDKFLLGKKDADILDNVSETIFDTAVVSTFFATAPHIAGAVYKNFIPKSDVVNLISNNNKIADILSGLDYKNLSKEEKIIIKSKISALKDSSSKIINNIAGMVGTTDTQELLDLNNFSKQMIDIKKQAQIINNSSKFSDIQKQAMLAEMKSEYSELNAVYNNRLSRAYRQEQAFKKADNFLNNRRLNKDIKLGEKFSTGILLDDPNVTFKYDSGKNIVDTMLKDEATLKALNVKVDEIEANDIANGGKKYSEEQRIFTQRAIASQEVNSNGWFDQNTNKIYVNKSKSLKEGRFNTARHEFLHKLSQNFGNNMGSIGTALYDFVKESHSGAKKFESTDFYKRMEQEKFDLSEKTKELNDFVQSKISKLEVNLKNNEISESEFDSSKSQLEKELSNDTKTLEDNAYEEVSNILAESLEENDIQIDKNAKAELRFDKEGNVIFSNAKDVFNFIVAYNESFSRTKGSELISAAAKGKVSGELIKEAPGKSAGGQIKLSKPQSEILKQELADLIENEFDYDPQDYEQQIGNIKGKIKKALEKEKTAPKAEPVKKEILTEEDEVKEIIKNEKGSIASDKVQKIYETKGLNGAQDIIDLFKPITKKIVDKRRDAPGFDRQLLTDEVETGVGGLFDLIRSYDASKGIPLAAYINKNLPLRAIASSKRVLDKQFNKDAAEEVGLMATETADQNMVERVAEKPKYKNALESKVLEPDVLKTISNKILTNIRTLKTRIDAPISLNRTVTPLIAEIRDAMGKQLDIDLKTAMGGKKDNQLRSFALKNKKYFLENMTTTFLMGADGKGGVPQAIQKQVDGKWTNYPDWVGKKIDREKTTTDNAGRTSGAELVRRLPNVVNNVSDADYLGQLLEADGNPIRGRKESWAKAMAEEIAFDVINTDLADEGPIFEALSANQQRLGYEVLNNFAATFGLQSDRGNIKRSKGIMKVLDEINNLPESTKLILTGQDGNKFIKYAFNVTNEDEAETNFYNTYSADDFSKEETNIIINAVKKLLSYYKKAQETNIYKKIISGPNENESFENYANRKVFNAMSKDLSISTILGIPLNSIQWNSAEQRKAARENMKNFHKNAIEYLVKNKTSKAEANKLFTRLFSRGFSYGKDQSMFEYQETFYKTFLKGIKGFDLSNVKNGRTITYNGKKVNSEIGTLEQKTKAPDIAKYLTSGNAKDIDYSKRKDLSDLSKKDLKSMMELFAGMKKAGSITDIQLGLIFKSLGGSMVSPLKVASELRYVADVKGYSKNPKDWVYEHVPPTAYITRMAIGVITGKSGMSIDEFMDNVMNNAYVTILPKSVDNIVNSIYKSTMPFYYKIGDNPLIRYFDVGFNGYEIPALEDLSTGEKINEPIKKNQFYGKKEIDIQESVLNSLPVIKKSKGISVFDFDDTVGLTEGNVLYTMPDGSKEKLNAEEFAKEGSRFLEEGAVFDFSEFSKVVGGKPGPMVEKMKKMIGKFGPDNFFILTARPANAAGPIHEFLSSIGIDIPLENIIGLGNSAAQAKADWMVGKAAEGYNDFYFSDDAIQNVKAVKDALDVLDVKSKIQQARLKFSKAISPEFNKIIEQNTGMEDFKVFSDIVARRRGTGKNRFDFYVPASAADFELLLYKFIGKGTLGEEQKKFFDDALLKPYANGNDLMDAARQSIKKDYKALTDIFPGIKKTIESLTPDGDFTYDQAIRVAMWNEEGVEIPGISQRDSVKLTDLVNADPELKAFKEGLIVTGRQGKGWVKPENFWDANTIISDLHNLTEGEGRKKFLAEFIENAELMFGKWEQGRLVGPNINKVEAVYGTNVREAIEDVLWRMTTGKNRGYGKDKETSRWANWVNGSTGTIMFLNTRSAALQLIGAVNFLNLRDNNPFAAAKAFANQKQYWADFAYIWNSDKIKERRGGLKEDVAAAEVASAAASSTNKANAVISYLLKVGYTPTQLADSFAIASGGAPYYRNRIKTYLSEGLSEQEAETKAWSDFTKVADETQQSGDPRDISKQQASGAGRLLLTFQNTAMQQSRIVKKSFLDLKNGRGDAKTNVAKIIYYLGVQNVLFAALQQGLIAVGFGFLDDEEDEAKKKALEKEKDKKVFDITNGVIDTILSGTGFVGKVVVTLKNMAKVYLDERDKNFKADYAKVVLEAANISPPIGSKLRKLYSGLQQTKYDKDLIKERGWGVMQDGRVHLGPMYSVAGKVVEAGTNVPLDRLATKIENASQAMNSQNEAWQRVMIGLGFNPYSLGIKETEGDVEIEATAKEIRKEEGLIKAKETRERTKDSIRGLPREERRRLKKEGLLKRREKKIKKRKMG